MTPPVRQAEHAPARGPLAAVVVRPSEEPAGPEVRLVYADLDLAEREDLRRSLGLSPGQAPDDDALVLAAYRAWGPASAERLGGAFAFAVWDGERGAMVAARDPVGLRPLFWATVGAAVVVGGDVQAVLDTGAVPDGLDDDMMAGALLDGSFKPIYFGRTYLRAVRELPGGHRLVADATGGRTDRYWRPEDTPRLALRDIDEVGEALREILREVVREAVAGDSPGTVGAHLSSGIDSTTVTAFAAEALGGAPLPAFPWQPPPPPGGPLPAEHRRIEALAHRWDLPVTYCPRTPDDTFAAVLLDATRDPTTMWAPEAPVRRAACAAGVRTLMSGWGGDEAISFSGRSLVTTHLARRGHLGPVLAMVARDPVDALRRARGVRQRASIGRGLPSLDAVRQSAARGEIDSFAHPDLLTRARIPDREPPPRDPRGYMAWLLRRGHIADRTGAWARAGAPYGLRYCYPLLDRRVLAFALGLPLEVWLTRDGQRRWPLRAAGEGLVPDVVRLGGKSEPMWIESGQRASQGVAERIAPLITPEAVGSRGDYVDVPKLRAAFERQLQGTPPPEEVASPAAGGGGAASYLALGDAHGVLPRGARPSGERGTCE
ncbi:asparagine synthase-related protein [Rubrivirga sp.]|uniref:asparagine synthase-related protein n=1 Tax=Rubrivirga sp. TaxID=1885344 RepID=UPI003B5201E9